VKLHGNAKLTPVQRRLLVARVLEEHWTIVDAADAAGVAERTAYRWVRRWKDGDHELNDRSSAPRRVPRAPARTVQLIETLRRTRMSSPKIAAKLRMAVSTVCAVLARIGLNRLSKLGPPEPPNRYERRRPGDLIHIDIKKLGRFVRLVTAAPKACTAAAGRAGTSCTSRSMTTLASPTSTCSTANAPRMRSRSWNERSNGSRTSACVPFSHDRQRQLLHLARLGCDLQTTTHHAHPHPTEPTAHQRKAERMIQTLQREWALVTHAGRRTRAVFAAITPGNKTRDLFM
jgi:transposase-like protein